MPAPQPCPNCGTGLNIPTPAPGRVRCPMCQTVLTLHGTKQATFTPPPVPGRIREAAPPRSSARSPDASPVAARKGGIGLWVIAVIVAALFVVGLVVGVDWALREGEGSDTKKAETKEKEKPKSAGPHVLLDEDFKAAYNDKLSIPKNWTEGEAFRVVKANDDLHALEVSKPTGVHFVQLPPVTLNGDFAIACFYHLDHPAFAQYHTVTLRLQDQGRTSLLPIVIDWAGKVLIGDDARSPPPSYKPLLPTRMLVKREGNKISVLLNDDLVGSKNLDTVVAFDTLKIGLAAGPGNAGRLARIFGIRVTSLTP